MAVMLRGRGSPGWKSYFTLCSRYFPGTAGARTRLDIAFRLFCGRSGDDAKKDGHTPVRRHILLCVCGTMEAPWLGPTSISSFDCSAVALVTILRRSGIPRSGDILYFAVAVLPRKIAAAYIKGLALGVNCSDSTQQIGGN
ncbi:unnamed protein product, partial [Iphiclides podalirius]